MKKGLASSAVTFADTCPRATAVKGPVADCLRCEYRVDPLGIDVSRPRLFWEMRDARRGAKQTAYQVLVASSPEKLAADEGDLWDSGTGRIEPIDPGGLCRHAAAVADAMPLEGAALGRRRQAHAVEQAGPMDDGAADARGRSGEVDRRGWPDDVSGSAARPAGAAGLRRARLDWVGGGRRCEGCEACEECEECEG